MKDSGIGISEKDMQRIFEPFTMLEDGQNLNPTGSGLGLSICKSILEHIDSKIWVTESQVKPDAYGRTGSTISFTFKVYKEGKNAYWPIRDNICSIESPRTSDRIARVSDI